MMQKVRKAVIPVKVLELVSYLQPKQIKKCCQSWINQPSSSSSKKLSNLELRTFLLFTGKSKRSIEDHFDSNFELEYNLKEKGKTDLLKLVDETTGMRLHFIRQTHPRGLGDAVLQAKAFVGNEPFVVMLGDDLMDITDDKAVPLTNS